MPASIEWTQGVLRAGPEHHDPKQLDPFTFAATVIRRGDEVEIIGAAGEVYPQLIKDVRVALRKEGVAAFWWERAVDRTKRLLRIKT